MTDLTNLRALCEAATPGPWHIGFGKVGSGFGTICHCLKWRPVDGKEYEVCMPDSVFIAAARTALPDLIDEVETLRSLLTQAQEALDGMDNLIGESSGVTRTGDYPARWSEFKEPQKVADALTAIVDVLDRAALSDSGENDG